MKASQPSRMARALAIGLPALIFSQTGQAQEPFSSLNESLELPVVLTPARLKQPRSETPASVSVITRQMLKDYGVRYLQDALRLVPGVTVGVTASNVPTLSYHGTNASEQRRLQVLIDGRSQYAPNLAAVDWLNMPLALEDIERIEITRGPNAVSYGANSFLAIVNIITRDAFDTPGGLLVYNSGSNGFQRYTARLGGNTEAFSWRMTGHGRKDDGYDRLANDSDARDSYDLDGFNVVLATPQNSADRFTFQAGLMNGDHEYRIQPNDGMLTPPDQVERDRFASLRWDREINRNHFFHVQAYYQRRERLSQWENCAPAVFFSPTLQAIQTANSRYAATLLGVLSSGNPGANLVSLAQQIQSGQASLGTPADDQLALGVINEILTGNGGQTVCGTINSDISEKRLDLELQDTWQISETLRMVSGFNVRQDTYASETYFGGEGQNTLGRIFANLEFRPTRNWVLNGGAMWERDETSDNSLSPRVAANYLITPNQSLRLVLSYAVRTPDTFEEDVRWRYVVRGLTPPLNGDDELSTFITQSPGNLEDEKILSREVGYYLALPERGLELDIKLFRDNLWDLISAPLQYFSFEPENNLALTQTGGELEIGWQPNWNNQLRLSYAYLDQDARYTGTADFTASFTSYDDERLFQIESRLNARHSGSLAWVHRFAIPLSTSVVYYVANDLNDRNWQRADWVLSYTRPLGKTEVTVSAKYEYLFDNEPLLFDDYQLDDRHHLYGSLELAF